MKTQTQVNKAKARRRAYLKVRNINHNLPRRIRMACYRLSDSKVVGRLNRAGYIAVTQSN